MFIFRIICAVLMAWAVNWAFGQPEADVLLEKMPEMEYVGLLSAAFVGAFSLARRQGWGLIVGAANGVWAGALSIILSGVFFTTYMGMSSVGIVQDFERWLLVLQGDLEPMFEEMLNYPLMLKTVLATMVVGLVTEAINWALTRLRKYRGEEIEEKDTVTTRVNPRDLW